MAKLFSILIAIIILKNTYGQYVFSIKIPYRSITINKIENTNMGQIIQFNGISWSISDFDIPQVYAGNWNASTNTPNLSSMGTLGEFYIVSVDGTTDLAGKLGTNSWVIGDSVFWDNTSQQWEKYISYNYVNSFNARKGVITPMANDYTWEQINKLNSSIGHISNVETSSKKIGETLQWNGNTWVSELENNPLDESITSTDIQNNSLLINDFSINANISQQKVQNLTANLNGLLPINGGTLSGNLDMNSNNIFNASSVNNIALENLSALLTANSILLQTKESAFIKGNLLSFDNNIFTISGGSGAKRESTSMTFSIPLADSSTDGYLTNTDWSIFNNKFDISADASTLTFNNQFLNIEFKNINNQKIRQNASLINSDYTITNNDFNSLLFVDGGSTITLPAPNTLGTSFQISIQRYDTVETTPVQITSTDSIDTQYQNIELSANYNSATFLSTGSTWIISKKNLVINRLPPCPDGYILIPSDPTLGTSEFCVMQFEAKNVSGTPTSQTSGTPWVNIDIATAFNECASITVSGFNGVFRLISNPEWITIARNIERQPSNWSNGTVGDGTLISGHNDNFPSNIISVSDINNPYDQTGNSGSSGPNERRTFSLSNGNIIWDFGGNVSEFVDWDTNDSSATSLPGIFSTNSNQELYNLPTGVGPNDLQSAFSFTSTQNAGVWRTLNNGQNIAIRGASYINTQSWSGIYTMIMDSLTSNYSDTGFRCVYEAPTY